MIDKEKNVLNEDELEKVSGGLRGSAAGRTGTNSQDKSEATEKHFCNNCGKEMIFIGYSGGRTVCKKCGGLWTGK
ncbi:bacteriocin [Butyrivibrio sp. CB08]|uniref:bacteriocin n=1 Tax=Butyrivibrio sp. CB08 TaxID=2364879 RepID=UPI000EAA7B27|nr:bacteriocin [Butyrivibrio sp. CB08]RKM55941.1 bacteriocin [Butyrivibrio sp. CB08]